jgi:hypothetical protein
MVAAIVCQAIVGHHGLPLPGAILLAMVFGAVLDVVKGRRQTQVQTQIYRQGLYFITIVVLFRMIISSSLSSSSLLLS